MKKRNELPAFKQLTQFNFDVERIIEEIRNMPAQANTDDLKEKDGYGELVGGKCGCLQKAFGLKFDTIEEAYQWLEDNDVEEADLKGQLPAGRRMAWDFRNYVKQYDDFIKEGDDGKYVVDQSPYKQIAFTAYNPDEENRVYEKKMPKSRLDERHYNKIKDWVKGTYIEEVINSFKGETHRARVAIMEPGCLINPHIDYNTDYSVRYHIPLTTNKDCGFFVIKDGEKIYQQMKPGEVWFLNQGLRHSAWNKGNTSRSHIIISVNGQEDLNE